MVNEKTIMHIVEAIKSSESAYALIKNLVREVVAEYLVELGYAKYTEQGGSNGNQRNTD